ncbi:UvrB/UvrC motif-containing protein [Bacillus horti]|uniref:Protein arginine kinase activator n=1 Tax=Caldalkalibacillus horti TaxID=77523 RepID=A0ABT9VYG8_9BACI|nr:UvrB/UvrC motif-containing protein [Bacillus horti]MDQ0166031.1 protein arginine kinase activator [Bacillus horti]
MLCQECQERQATLHFTKIVNGQKTEFHICEVCAKEKGDALPGMNNSFSIHNLLSGLLSFDTAGTVNQSPTQKLQCPTCGLTFSQFSRSGRFGCADCYKEFGDRLEPMLRKVHSGNVSHFGKIPKRSGNLIQTKREIQDLKKKLQQSITNEEFEQSAKLRDQIRELEHKLET